MPANSFGHTFRITTFGESHGVALGAVIDGCPSGVEWSDEILKNELARRRPGQTTSTGSVITSSRNEGDVCEVLSGVFEGHTLGTPIAMIVRNQDARSQDYVGLAPRAGHADDAWKEKFGLSDPRGGGRSSGRETVSRVMGGAVAQMFLRSALPALRVTGFMSQAGPLVLSDDERQAWTKFHHDDFAATADGFVGRFPSDKRGAELEALLLKAKTDGQSYGGTAELWIDGLPPGLGQPVFHKLKADLALALMGVGATTSIEIGAGVEAMRAEGTIFHSKSQDVYGGIRGGISTGDRIQVRVGFKPTSSLMDVAKRGRHDPLIVPRAIPVLEAMAYLVLADHTLWMRSDRLHLDL